MDLPSLMQWVTVQDPWSEDSGKLASAANLPSMKLSKSKQEFIMGRLKCL